MPKTLIDVTQAAQDFLRTSGYVFTYLDKIQLDEDKNDIQQIRNQYRSNAEHAVALGELRKASELLWGAVTQQLKALAASRNTVIRSHRQFFDFLRQFAAESGENWLYEEFVSLNALHTNFYDEIIPPDTFPILYQKAIEYIARLERLQGSNDR
ncbi:MAG: PaREP1 family protein [Candidatus Acidiferrum sp.]